MAKYNNQFDTHKDNSTDTAQKLHDTIVLNTKILHRSRVADFLYQISNSNRHRRDCDFRGNTVNRSDALEYCVSNTDT